MGAFTVSNFNVIWTSLASLSAVRFPHFLDALAAEEERSGQTGKPLEDQLVWLGACFLQEGDRKDSPLSSSSECLEVIMMPNFA